MAKIIVFDLWETVAKKPYQVLPKLIDHFGIEGTREDNLERYESSVQIAEYHDNEDMAKSFLKAFSLEYNRDNIRFVIQTIKHSTDQCEYMEGMKELVRRLKENYRIALMSNTTNLQFEEGNRRMGLTKLFNHVVLSYNIKAIKPSKKAFKGLMKELRAKEEDIIFIDDMQNNCGAAKLLGINSIVFKDAEQLEKELEKLGIILK